MSIIKAILNDTENVGDIIKNEVENTDWFEKDYLYPACFGVAQSQIKYMAENMNEAKAELKQLLEDNSFDPTQEYMIGKAIKLLSWEL